jgi:transposase-like protein
VRRLIKIALVVLGIRAFLRWRKKRRQQHEATTTSASPAPDPADELRRKLAESREEDVADAPAPPEATVADRRAEVHEQGRSALDEMKSTSEG